MNKYTLKAKELVNSHYGKSMCTPEHHTNMYHHAALVLMLKYKVNFLIITPANDSSCDLCLHSVFDKCWCFKAGVKL